MRFCFINFGNKCEVYINRLPVPDPKSSLVLVVVDAEADIQHHQATAFVLDNTILVLDYVYELKKKLFFFSYYMPTAFCLLRQNNGNGPLPLRTLPNPLTVKLRHSDRWSQMDCMMTMIHAHRMRALCPAYSLRSHTLITIILADCTAGRRKQPPQGGTLLYCKRFQQAFKEHWATHSGYWQQGRPLYSTRLSTSSFRPVMRGKIPCTDILSVLFEKGLSTVYVEGGSATTSSFLAQKSIDVLLLSIVHWSSGWD